MRIILATWNESEKRFMGKRLLRWSQRSLSKMIIGEQQSGN